MGGPPPPGLPSAKRPFTSETANDGKTLLCKEWNDARGCPEPCSKKRRHGCDVLVAKDIVCEQSHTRGQHTGPVFGYLKQ